MSDLATRLRRLLFLVPYIARQADGVPIDDLVKELEIDREKLLVDLDLLTQVGPPGGDPGEYLLITVEDGKVYVDLAQRLTRPLRLTSAEGTSLLLGLQALREANIAPYDQALASAEQKLLRALGTEAKAAKTQAQGTVVTSEGGAVAKHVRELLAAARAKTAVQVEYFSASSGEGQRRGLEPYGIVQHAGAWYVVGHCQKRGDTRTFRVDRIATLSQTSESFEVPADFDLETYRRERLFVPSADAVTVCVRFDKIGAARVGSVWPTDKVEHFPDGSAEVAIDCEGLEWVLGWTLLYGRHARIVSPPEAQKALLNRIDAIREEVR